MSNADGTVRIDTTLDTEGIKQGTNEAEKELEGLGENAKKAEDSLDDLGDEAEKTKDSIDDLGGESKKTGETLGGDLADGFRKLGAAIVAAGVIDAVVDFSKKAIDLASDLEEVQNVVDVTFDTMSDSVNKFAKDAQKTAGLSEKMAKQYVGTFGAMADSFGFTEAEAYEMSTALTQLTGDVASFYNLSQDEAMGKLKGVFTGESEALKELGVVMTQTALDSYAMANGFGKVSSEMSEQEKVALRYQFVMDQLSAASGDFARTQEGWANQSKVLTLQVESLMATLGTKLIDMLSPSVQFLNSEVLPALQNAVDRLMELLDPPPSKKLEITLKDVSDSVEEIEGSFETTSKEIDTAATKAGIYREMLADLEKTGLDTAEAQQQYAHIVSRLNEIYPELNLQINSHTGSLNANSKAQLENLGLMKERALQAAIESQYSDILNAQATATMAVTDAQNALTDIEASRKTIIEQLTSATGLTIGELYALDVAQRKGEETTRKLSAEEQSLLLNLTLLTGEEVQLTNAIEDGKKEISGYDEKLEELRKTYGLAEESAEAFESAQSGVTESITDTRTTLEELEVEYGNAKEAARDSIESQVGLFDELSVKSNKTAADIIKNWESQRIAFDNYSANLQKAIDMGLDEALVKQLSDGSTESMAILNEFVNSTDVSVSDINAAFKKTEESKETVSATMAEIQTDMAEKLSAIESDIRTSWNDASGDVKLAIRRMQADINSLRGKTVTIQVKTSGNIGSSGKDLSLSNPSNRAAPSPSNVPYLASGAVIPPNAPFMAVLGDQRHGTNVEAPLTTIQEAVANVMGDQVSAMVAGFNALIEENQRLRQVVEGIELGDSVIGQAAERYQNSASIMWGV